jgi:hypothetical protein
MQEMTGDHAYRCYEGLTSGANAFSGLGQIISDRRWVMDSTLCRRTLESEKRTDGIRGRSF